MFPVFAAWHGLRRLGATKPLDPFDHLLRFVRPAQVRPFLTQIAGGTCRFRHGRGICTSGRLMRTHRARPRNLDDGEQHINVDIRRSQRDGYMDNANALTTSPQAIINSKKGILSNSKRRYNFVAPAHGSGKLELAGVSFNSPGFLSNEWGPPPQGPGRSIASSLAETIANTPIKGLSICGMISRRERLTQTVRVMGSRYDCLHRHQRAHPRLFDQPTPPACWLRQQAMSPLADPVAACQFQEHRPVQTALRPKVDVLHCGQVAQLGGLAWPSAGVLGWRRPTRRTVRRSRPPLLAASTRLASRPRNSRSILRQVRKPCSGCGRRAITAMISASVAGPMPRASRCKRPDAHSA
jgi:hypothetical protein